MLERFGSMDGFNEELMLHGGKAASADSMQPQKHQHNQALVANGQRFNFLCDEDSAILSVIRHRPKGACDGGGGVSGGCEDSARDCLGALVFYPRLYVVDDLEAPRRHACEENMELLWW